MIKKSKKRIKRDWLSTVIYILTLVFALIEYGSEGREWFKHALGGEWQLGFFEGVIVTLVIFGVIMRYGSIFYELFLGLIELGRQRKVKLN